MLRLALAVLAAIGVLFVGAVLLDDDSSYLAMLGVALVAMLVCAAVAPHVFIRGDWPPKKSDRAGHS